MNCIISTNRGLFVRINLFFVFTIIAAFR